MDEWTDKQTNARRTRLYLLVENWQFTQYRRQEESTPEAPAPPPCPLLQPPPTRKRPRREPSNSVTGTGGVTSTPGTMQNHSPQPIQTKMNSSTSYRTWIGFNDNSAEGGITVYTVACYLSEGLQADVFAFENDAYLYLVDQAEGLTDEQRIELGQLAELPDREAFWTLFNESRLAAHQLPDRITHPPIAAQPFQGMNDFESERAAKAARFRQLAEHANIATGRHFAARQHAILTQPIITAAQQRRQSRSYAVRTRTWFRVVATLADGKRIHSSPALDQCLLPHRAIRLPRRGQSTGSLLMAAD